MDSSDLHQGAGKKAARAENLLLILTTLSESAANHLCDKGRIFQSVVIKKLNYQRR